MVPIGGMNLGWLIDTLASAAQEAQGASSGTGGTSQQQQGPNMLWMLGLLAVFFYLIVLRPQRREKQERQKLLDAMKKGDRIVTIGGMHGKVVEVHEAEKTVSIEIAPKVVVKYSRAAVQTVDSRGGQEKEDANGAK